MMKIGVLWVLTASIVSNNIVGTLQMIRNGGTLTEAAHSGPLWWPVGSEDPGYAWPTDSMITTSILPVLPTSQATRYIYAPLAVTMPPVSTATRPPGVANLLSDALNAYPTSAQVDAAAAGIIPPGSLQGTFSAPCKRGYATMSMNDGSGNSFGSVTLRW